VRHDRAIQAQTIWGANLIPSGPRAAVTIRAASRRVRARRQKHDPEKWEPAFGEIMCNKEMGGSDGGALATPGWGRWELRRRSAAAVRFVKSKAKSPRRISPCGLATFTMMALCR
jgi:hypothetical protein